MMKRRAVWDPSVARRAGMGAAAALLLALAATGGRAADDLVRLSDEFTRSAALTTWHQVYADEGWSASQLAHLDVGGTLRGWMALVPYACTWYQDYRGPLIYKPVTGDFVVTTHLRA